MPLIDRELDGGMKCASFLKLTELVKKPSNLNRIGKEKSYCLISHSLACFVEPIRRLCFCFAEGLAGLTDGLAMGGAELSKKEIVVGFFR